MFKMFLDFDRGFHKEVVNSFEISNENGETLRLVTWIFLEIFDKFKLSQ